MGFNLCGEFINLVAAYAKIYKSVAEMCGVMNTLFHFLLNYSLIELSLGNAREYIWIILIASIILDLDHLPYYIRFRKRVLNEGLGEKSRSFMHELPGMAIVSLLCVGLFFFSGQRLAEVVFLSFMLHYAVDFIVGQTRPFWPLSDKVLHSPLGIKGKRNRLAFEIVSTLIGGVVFWLLLR